MIEKTKKYFKPSLYIIGAILWFMAVYSIYPALANVALGTLEPGCVPGTAGCTVDSPLVTTISTSTNVAMTSYALSFDTSTLFIDPTNNRIGINTTSPLSALDVYGNIIISTTSGYLSFNSTVGTSGYGIRDNSGTLQFKNSGDSWIDMVTSTALSADSVGATELSTTTVTAGSYGSASQAMILTVDVDGRLTSASTSSISIAGTQITSGVVSSAYGGTDQDSSAWNGFAKITNGVWSAAFVGIDTPDITGILPMSNGGTGTSSVLINGSLVFSNGSNLTEDNSNLFWDDIGKRLGIGTSTVSAKLHVEDTNEQLRLGYSGSNYTSFAHDNLDLLTINSTGSVTVSSTNSISMTPSADFNVGGSVLFVDTVAGRVGIGTTTPQVGLHIGASASGSSLNSSNDIFVSGKIEVDGYSNFGDDTLVVDTSSGNRVGINISNPSATLEVMGNSIMQGNLQISSQGSFTVAGTSTFGGILTTSANALVLMSASSTIQMAYDSSNYTQWTIGSDGQLSIASGQPTTTFSNNVVIDNLYSGILTMPEDGGLIDVMNISVSPSAVANSTQGYNFTVDGLQAMSIYGLASAGTVTGIGVSIGTTNTSSYKLYVKAANSSTQGIGVDGYIKATGYITATATLDVAESYPVECSSDENCPGSFDVVCSSDKDDNFIVSKCSNSYSDNIVGVVSEKPGFGLGDYDPSTYSPNTGVSPSNYRMIALAGRVPVKISNINGNIKTGDYLTSSNIAGVAVKAIEPGRVIGVALTSSNSVTGTVTMFVNPHFNPGNINFVSSELPDEYGLLDNFTMVIKSSLRKLGLVIEKGIAKVKELRTDKLCVGDTCINENDLKQMLNNNGTSGSTPVKPPTPPADPVKPPTPPADPVI